MQVVQTLLLGLQYVIRFQHLATVSNFVNNVIMGDGARFHLNGYINKQNRRRGDTENPSNPQNVLFGALIWLKSYRPLFL